MTIYIEPEYVTRLEDENEQLKNDLIRAEAMEDYWKINSYELKDDSEEYINRLKQELFNLYLKHYN